MGAAGWATPDSADQETAAGDDLQSQKKGKKAQDLRYLYAAQNPAGSGCICAIQLL